MARDIFGHIHFDRDTVKFSSESVAGDLLVQFLFVFSVATASAKQAFT